MICLHCKSQIEEKFKLCPYCGESIFPQQDEMHTSNELIKIDSVYCQVETTLMRKVKFSTIILLLIYGILMLISLLFPLLTYRDGINTDFINSFSYINFGEVNVLTLINNLTQNLDFESLQGNTYLININIIKVYNVLTLTILSIIAIVALIIIVYSIKDLIKKTYSGKYKNLIGLICILSFILLLGFSFDGLGNLIILCSSILVLMWFFVSEIISKEKRLKTMTSIIKFILIVFFGIVIFSVCFETMYIQDGVKDLIPTSFVDTEVVSGKPFTQIILQFIAIYSFDAEVSMYLNMILGASFTISLVLLTLSCVSFVSLLKSFSNQNVKIPLKRMWICAVLIVCFVTLNYLFCSFANDAFYANELAEVLKDGEVLSAEESLALQKAESYFKVPVSAIIGAILAFPCAIYATIAKKMILKIKN